MTAFADLGRTTQLRRVRRAASDALTDYPIEVAAIDLVVHEFNTTYRVTATDGSTFALRLNVNSVNGLEAVLAETAFARRCASIPDVDAAAPVATSDGRWATPVEIGGLGRRPAVLYRWLDAPNLGERVGDVSAEAIGRLAAAIHAHSPTPGTPEFEARPIFDTVYMDGPDRLSGLDAAWYTDEIRVVVDEATAVVIDRVGDALDRDHRLLHADLHPWNVKWRRGRLGVFDFDDCGWGAPALELAISAFYLRRRRGAAEALLRGYAGAGGSLGVDSTTFEALVAARQLMLFNDLVASATAGHQAMVADYSAIVARRFRHWLTSGRFEPEV